MVNTSIQQSGGPRFESPQHAHNKKYLWIKFGRSAPSTTMAVSSQRNGLSMSDSRAESKVAISGRSCKGSAMPAKNLPSLSLTLRVWESHWLEWILSGKKSQTQKNNYLQCNE